MNISDFIDKFLNSNQVILAFGETFHGTHELVVAEVVKHLAGFSGIFLEKPVSQQSDVDEYLSTGIINEKLEKHFQNAAKEGKNIRGTLLLILDSAKLNKLPVTCVDSSKEKTEEYSKESTIGKYFLRGSSRDKDMFENIQKILIEKKKYLFFGGFQHLMGGTHFRSGELTLGTRLRAKYKDCFFSVAIYKLKDEDQNIIEEDIVAINLRKPESEKTILDNFIQKSGIATNEPDGSLKFDGYILHK
ncbi:MAG: hypothetical protein WAV56_00820 [Microgenomates group bacterium]